MIKSMTDDWQYKSEKLKIFTVPLQEKKKHNWRIKFEELVSNQWLRCFFQLNFKKEPWKLETKS